MIQKYEARRIDVDGITFEVSREKTEVFLRIGSRLIPLRGATSAVLGKTLSDFSEKAGAYVDPEAT